MKTTTSPDDRPALERLNRWYEQDAKPVRDGADLDEALLALRDLRLLRGILDRAETEAVHSARRAGATWPEVAGMYGASLDLVHDRWRDDNPRMGPVWSRIASHQGEVFVLTRGGQFSYRVSGRYLVLDRANWLISSADLEAALDLMPLRGNLDHLQHLTAPDYLRSILMDDRIRGDDW